MFRPNGSRRSTAGFTLIEVLVALAVVAISLAAIGSLIAVTTRGARAVGLHLTLVETARAIVTGPAGPPPASSRAISRARPRATAGAST